MSCPNCELVTSHPEKYPFRIFRCGSVTIKILGCVTHVQEVLEILEREIPPQDIIAYPVSFNGASLDVVGDRENARKAVDVLLAYETERQRKEEEPK